MFRRRIYAQGFTLLAMVAGSAYWEGDRKKRKEFDGLLEEKRKKEKHDAWIRELEARDQEDKEMELLRSKMVRGRAAEDADRDGRTNVRSVLEETDSRNNSGIFAAAARLWQSRS